MVPALVGRHVYVGDESDLRCTLRELWVYPNIRFGFLSGIGNVGDSSPIRLKYSLMEILLESYGKRKNKQKAIKINEVSGKSVQ